MLLKFDIKLEEPELFLKNSKNILEILSLKLSQHPEKCFVESTKNLLAQQTFLFKYGPMEILFKLTKKILLIFFCNSNKKVLH